MKANKNLLSMQSGDVPVTYAQVDKLINDVGLEPSTSTEFGLCKFVNWFKREEKNIE